MREIKFRGKRIVNGEWVYGYYEFLRTPLIHWMEEYRMGGMLCLAQVDPSTVGQYTGLKDKNGTEIYEGDVLKSVAYGYVGEVKYVPENAAFLVFWSDDKGRHAGYLDDGMCSRIEVIGNIHDNPELLGGVKND